MRRWATLGWVALLAGCVGASEPEVQETWGYPAVPATVPSITVRQNTLQFGRIPLAHVIKRELEVEAQGDVEVSITLAPPFLVSAPVRLQKGVTKIPVTVVSAEPTSFYSLMEIKTPAEVHFVAVAATAYDPEHEVPGGDPEAIRSSTFTGRCTPAEEGFRCGPASVCGVPTCVNGQCQVLPLNEDGTACSTPCGSAATCSAGFCVAQRAEAPLETRYRRSFEYPANLACRVEASVAAAGERFVLHHWLSGSEWPNQFAAYRIASDGETLALGAGPSVSWVGEDWALRSRSPSALARVDLDTGATRWSFEPGWWPRGETRTVLLLQSGAEPAITQAIDKSSAKKLWSRPGAFEALNEEVTVLRIGYGQFEVVGTLDGQPQATFAARGAVVGIDGGLIALRYDDCEGYRCAIEYDVRELDGTPRWSKRVNEYIYTSGAYLRDGVIYSTSRERYSLATGERLTDGFADLMSGHHGFRRTLHEDGVEANDLETGQPTWSLRGRDPQQLSGLGSSERGLRFVVSDPFQGTYLCHRSGDGAVLGDRWLPPVDAASATVAKTHLGLLTSRSDPADPSRCVEQLDLYDLD